MKKTTLLLSLLFFSFQIQAIDFYTGTYNEALDKAGSENKLILLYFTAKWCGPCQYMSKYIFTVENIDYEVTKNYIALKLDMDIERNKEIYYKYSEDKGVSVPKFFLINSKEEVLKSHIGSLKLNQFKEFINIPDSNKSIYKAESDSIAQVRTHKNAIKPSAWNKFMYNSNISRWKLGVKIGMDFNNFETKGMNLDYDRIRTGINCGLFLDYTNKYFLFQPGVMYCQKGAKSSSPKETIRLNYLEIPLKVSINTFKHKIMGCAQNIRLNIEPYWAYALRGRHITESGNNAISFGKGSDELNRYDYGVKAGISFQLGSYEPSFGYDIGLNNLSNESGEKMYNRGFYFNFALIFGK